MKKAIIMLVGLTAVLLIAGCTSPTTSNTTPSVSATAQPEHNAVLDAYFAAHYRLVGNFTRYGNQNGTLVYQGDFQENRTLHTVTFYIADNMTTAQRQFEVLRANYLSMTIPNETVTVIANNSTHWGISVPETVLNGWLVQANTAGPFGLALNTPYVAVVQDITPPETAPSTTAVSVVAGAG